MCEEGYRGPGTLGTNLRPQKSQRERREREKETVPEACKARLDSRCLVNLNPGYAAKIGIHCKLCGFLVRVLAT